MLPVILTILLRRHGTLPPPPVVPTDIRTALLTHLLSSSLASQVGTRIFPMVIPQSNKVFPAITYMVVSDVPSCNLAGADGMSVARVQIALHSKAYTDCFEGIQSLRTMFSGFAGLLGGTLTVTATFLANGGDSYDFPNDGTGQGTFMIVQDYTFHYRLPGSN